MLVSLSWQACCCLSCPWWSCITITYINMIWDSSAWLKTTSYRQVFKLSRVEYQPSNNLNFVQLRYAQQGKVTSLNYFLYHKYLSSAYEESHKHMTPTMPSESSLVWILIYKTTAILGWEAFMHAKPTSITMCDIRWHPKHRPSGQYKQYDYLLKKYISKNLLTPWYNSLRTCTMAAPWLTFLIWLSGEGWSSWSLSSSMVKRGLYSVCTTSVTCIFVGACLLYVSA